MYRDRRFGLSRLAEVGHRRAATRWLLTVTLAGFALTLLLLIATGRGTGRWFFVLSIWFGLIFLPLWLLIQAFQSIGPALRRRLTAGLAGRDDRYRHLSTAALVVEDLFDREVVMPRIATPGQTEKVREAAAAFVVRAGRQEQATGALPAGVTRCLLAVEAWTRDLSRWAAADVPENIQARWAAVRALAALAALTKTLVAVAEDRGDRVAPEGRPPLDLPSLHAFLDGVLDYCDELALQVEVLPWTEPSLALDGAPGSGTLRTAWQRYVETPPPAPTALEAFIAAALHG